MKPIQSKFGHYFPRGASVFPCKLHMTAVVSLKTNKQTDQITSIIFCTAVLETPHVTIFHQLPTLQPLQLRTGESQSRHSQDNTPLQCGILSHDTFIE